MAIFEIGLRHSSPKVLVRFINSKFNIILALLKLIIVRTHAGVRESEYGAH